MESFSFFAISVLEVIGQLNCNPIQHNILSYSSGHINIHTNLRAKLYSNPYTVLYTLQSFTHNN